MYHYCSWKRQGWNYCGSMSVSDISVNILNISQTIVEGYFNMMMIVDFTNCTKEIAVVVNEMEELGKTIGVDIHCQREDIFEKMHRL